MKLIWLRFWSNFTYFLSFCQYWTLSIYLTNLLSSRTNGNWWSAVLNKEPSQPYLKEPVKKSMVSKCYIMEDAYQFATLQQSLGATSLDFLVWSTKKTASNKLWKIMKYNQKDSYIVHFTLIQTAHITCIAMSIEFSLNILWKFKCFFDLLVSDILKGNNHQKTGNPTN